MTETYDIPIVGECAVCRAPIYVNGRSCGCLPGHRRHPEGSILVAPTNTGQQVAGAAIRVMRPQPHWIRHSTIEPTQFWINVNFDPDNQRWDQIRRPANSSAIKIDGIWYWRSPAIKENCL